MLPASAPSIQASAPAPSGNAVAEAAAQAPQLAGYRLQGLIGSGTVGEVYLAIEPVTQQQVALKLLRPAAPGSLSDHAQARELFLAEADVARRLHHPAIVRVLAAGEEAGRAWMAMELLAGCTLERYTRPARLLPEPVVLGIALRLAEALAYAHGQGVLHRDLKPANVIVDWAQRRVTLTDFGLARLIDAERSRTGLILGTPFYMAPEQLAGAAPSARGDLYALGVMLFQLLSGRLPHESPSMGELLRQVAQQPAPDLRSLRPELPAALAEAVAGLLAKRPKERSGDAADVARQLAALTPAVGGVATGAKSRD